MEYFIIKPAVDTKETGPEYPQVVFNNPLNINPNPVLIANQPVFGKLPPNDLEFDYFEMNGKKTKLTDVMSSDLCVNGFILSSRMKLLLEEHNLDTHRFYPVKIKRNGEWITNYYYFHSASNLPQFVDYEKSKFYVGTLLGDVKYELDNISSFDDLIKKNILADKGELIEAKYLYLNSSFPFHLDLFRINAFNFSTFISGRLKDKMKEQNITGIDIYEARNFLFTPNLA